MATQQYKAWSVVIASTLAFTVCFMIWMMFAVIGIPIKESLGLNETEFGILVATPVLTGSLIRLPLGMWTDKFGGRLVFFVLMLSTVIPIYMISRCTEFWQFLVTGLFVGIAGGSFTVGIAYCARWFPKNRQGLAMGIFGAGNTGAAVTKLVAPLLVVAYGWTMVPQVYAVLMLVTAILFWFFTFSDPAHKVGNAVSMREQLTVLKDPRVWKYSQYYSIVFGGYVALALWMTKYVATQSWSHLKNPAAPSALTYAWIGPFVGALIRPVGGWISDKVGGSIVTQVISAVMVVASAYAGYIMMQAYHSATPEIYFTQFLVVFVILFAATGIGNGSTFRTVGVIFDRTQAGPVLGWTSAVAAYGSFIAPEVIKQQIKAGTPEMAMYGFAAFYALCLILNWWFYLRDGSEIKNP